MKCHDLHASMPAHIFSQSSPKIAIKPQGSVFFLAWQINVEMSRFVKLLTRNTEVKICHLETSLFAYLCIAFLLNLSCIKQYFLTHLIRQTAITQYVIRPNNITLDYTYTAHSLYQFDTSLDYYVFKTKDGLYVNEFGFVVVNGDAKFE